MVNGFSIPIIANFVLIAGLVLYGLTLFIEYHGTGRWANSITALLAGLGMLALALALLLTPRNAQVVARMAATGAAAVLLWISSGLLLAAIAAFGLITYSKPVRRWQERRHQGELNHGRTKNP